MNRDTFIFHPQGAQLHLFIGINQKLTQASFKSLHRWIRLTGSPTRCYELHPVELSKLPRMILAYRAKPTGPAISPFDSTTLPAGDYGWYETSTDATMRVTSFDPNPWKFSFLEEDSRASEWIPKKLIEETALTDSIKDFVMRRDKRCVFTGSTQQEALDVSWIFPPLWSFEDIHTALPDEHDLAPYIEHSNAITMQKDLIPLFLDNAFGVDIDDEYRIVVFKDLGVFNLPSHLPNQSESTSVGWNDKFLHEHFRWCLRVNLLGGDISEDYSHRRVHAAYDSFGAMEDQKLLAPSNRRWKSTLGQEILDMCRRLKDDRLTPLYDDL